jgi:hypothetical protein
MGALVVLVVLVLWSGEQHVRMEATAGTVEIDFAPGQPIAWATSHAKLLDCNYFAQAGSTDSVKTEEGSEVELGAIVDREQQKKVRARVSIYKKDLLIELSALNEPACASGASPADCAKQASRLAVLDSGTGSKKSLCLPAQLLLEGEGLVNGLTLEFRGDIRVGNDLSSSLQPQLTGGRYALWEVRPSFLNYFAESQFEIEKRDLGVGDKLLIAAANSTVSMANAAGATDKAQATGEDVPKGFLRIASEDNTRPPQMTVYAAAPAEWTQIVHPFSAAERPKSHWLKRVWADDLLSKVAAFIIALVTIRSGVLPTQEQNERPTGERRADDRRKDFEASKD